MKALLTELVTLISSGCMSDEAIDTVAGEAAQAHAAPADFLAANPDVNYDDSFPIPLWQWVVLGSLPETVLFQADTGVALLEQIMASFGPAVEFHIKPKQLARTEPEVAVNRIQTQLAALSKDKGGYVLLDFCKRLDFDFQAVLVYGQDLPRVLELCAQAGFHAVPTLQGLREGTAG
ncbi:MULTISPECIES: hypothetical protein [unclassified Pseudomonas]|uniref:hypothetical protein n=1 Tax=unclassified Pseudomonas TaxID=196821 RepID=UPI000BCDDC81|nr:MULTISPECIES: hypothetical protein [unclassified Pseudomonas]PVZ20101.1 hypothetical protein F474_00694 [Pseudomonas sp. URIL14HWK12:I12]PVZ27167.1 hypothetical protein F470_00349 [Pseudomonas sp. URIL14HWK12:I10]PVZ38056.1 hypothetical protein F472_00694 [Pseudomonas sp. URIL14HWK12:I11]SNZ04692.1 hypothetical protein SAMN05660463_00710 [Pseudomonas sp. URIL14HWK12:I9]